MNKHSAYDQSLRSRIRAWFHPAEARLRSMYRLGYAAGQRAANVIPSTWRGYRPTDSAQVPLLPAPTLISGIAGGQHWDGKPGTWAAQYARPVAHPEPKSDDPKPDEPKPAHNTRPPEWKLPSLNTYLRQHGFALPEPVHQQPAPTTSNRVPFDPTPLATLPPARFLQMSEPIVGLDALKTFASPEKTAQNEVAALPTWYPEAPQRHTDAIPRQTTGEFLLDDKRDTLFDDVPVSDVLDDDGNAPTVLHERTRFKNTINQLSAPPESENKPA